MLLGNDGAPTASCPSVQLSQWEYAEGMRSVDKGGWSLSCLEEKAEICFSLATETTDCFRDSNERNAQI